MRILAKKILVGRSPESSQDLRTLRATRKRESQDCCALWARRRGKGQPTGKVRKPWFSYLVGRGAQEPASPGEADGRTEVGGQRRKRDHPVLFERLLKVFEKLLGSIRKASGFYSRGFWVLFKKSFWVLFEKPGQAKPSQAKPSQAKPSQAKPSQTKPSQNKPSQTKPSPFCFNTLRLFHSKSF